MDPGFSGARSQPVIRRVWRSEATARCVSPAPQHISRERPRMRGVGAPRIQLANRPEVPLCAAGDRRVSAGTALASAAVGRSPTLGAWSPRGVVETATPRWSGSTGADHLRRLRMSRRPRHRRDTMRALPRLLLRRATATIASRRLDTAIGKRRRVAHNAGCVRAVSAASSIGHRNASSNR